jgi:precorrin-8X/cobalt-precorrin-8 methylmutase
MPEIVADLAWSAEVAPAARHALAAGAPIIADCRMVADGVTRSRLPAQNAVICPLEDQAVPRLAREKETTRSAAAVELWQPHLAGAVVAIGNAPTALFRLLELLLEGAPRPAAILGFPVGFVGAAESKEILGFPVGFVGAAESKEALIDTAHGVPFLTLRGRRGGSALAAAAVNALAAPEEPAP